MVSFSFWVRLSEMCSPEGLAKELPEGLAKEIRILGDLIDCTMFSAQFHVQIP